MSEAQGMFSRKEKISLAKYAAVTIAVIAAVVAVMFAAKDEESFSVSISLNAFLMALSFSILVLFAMLWIEDLSISERLHKVRSICIVTVIAAISVGLSSLYSVEHGFADSYPEILMLSIPVVIICGIIFGIRYAILNIIVMRISLLVLYPVSLIWFFLSTIVISVAGFAVIWYLLRNIRLEIRFACIIPVPLLMYIGYKCKAYEISYNDAQFFMYYIIPAMITLAVMLVIYLIFMRFNEMRDEYHTERQNIQMSKGIQESVMASKHYEDDDLVFTADMRTSYEIGGDFYDTFTNNSGLRFFIIGDVSGKNMPAAMSMMETLALAEAASMDVNTPSEVMATVNKLFCRANRAEQFVTLWIGAYDSSTCTLYHSNAGHMFPILSRGGGYAELEGKRGPAVGFYESSEYPVNVTRISNGDRLFLYTDGVTEAFSMSGEQFGKERLIDTLNSCPNGHEIEDIISEVSEFSGDCQLSDDITVMLISFIGSDIDVMDIRSETTNLYDVQGFITKRMTEIGFDEPETIKMQIAVEEIFINICRYAYLGETGDVEVICRKVKDGIEVSLTDRGIPFNPLIKCDPDINSHFDEKEGGFGIYMTKAMSDSIRYRNVDGRNILTLRFEKKSQ